MMRSWRSRLDWRLDWIARTGSVDEGAASRRLAKACAPAGSREASPSADGGHLYDGTAFHGVVLDARGAPVWLRVLVELERGARLGPASLGLSRGWVRGRFASGTLLYSRLAALASHPAVRRVELSSALRWVRAPFERAPDAAAAHFPAAVLGVPDPSPLDGKDVLVGVVDDMLDPRVPELSGPGGTRVVSYWVQRRGPGAGRPPRAFGYGTLYTSADIDAGRVAPEHLPDPSNPAADAHGTKVTCIAAGGSGAYRGVAPGAAVVFVATPPSGADALVDAQAFVDAVQFIDDEATRLGVPCVINVSLGDGLGPHDGTSHVERFLADMAARPGRVVVVCAGNANRSLHASGKIGGADLRCSRHDLTDVVDEDTIDVWYRGPGGASLSLLGDTSTIGPFAAAGGVEVHPPAGEVVLSVESSRPPPDGAWGVFRIRLRKWPFPDEREIHLRVAGGPGEPADRPVHAWLNRNDDAAVLFFRPADAQRTVTSPGTAKGVITAGACEFVASGSSKDSRMWRFSGLGDTLDGRPKPEILAVGGQVLVVEPQAGGGSTIDNLCTGTSVSAPLVSGAAALLLQGQTSLTTLDVLDRLAQLGVHAPADLPPRLDLAKLFDA